ncbi:helix-turn-helix transcriptional regulator [Kitasatospora mediocidica]|uniref:helix-turn-helix transcriptional regulator n=1 Tax=Kitasatospora mediocidica TaxID=58352 RepID=UPI000562A1DE|nr:response regulator transcription factor [Kitasatospora mediocidica]
MNKRIPVHVHAADPIMSTGLEATMRPRPEVLLVPAADLDEYGVVLQAADAYDDTALQELRRLHRNGCRRAVLVVLDIDDATLLDAVSLGVCSVVPRSEATASRLAELVVRAGAGEAALPPDLLGRLLKQVGRLRQDHEPRPNADIGLSERETDVLKLVADGLSTQDIAHQLRYSDRTVKNTLHSITTRYHLNNRAHAVAYALREGLI